ncbi:MAG: hypothetical protein RL215_645 [Planctomycetota bacterium]
MLAGGETVIGDVVSGEKGLASAGGKEACEHFHGGAFAGAVWSQEGADLSAGDSEADVAGSGEVAVEFAEPAGFDHQFGGGGSGV